MDATISKIRLEIQELEHRLTSMRDVEASLLGRLGSHTPHNVAKASFGTLPIHVVQQIFVQCLPQASHIAPYRPTDAPVVLVHVCRHWREVAFGYGRLWRSVALRVRDEDDLGMFTQVFNMWLPRTGNSVTELHIISTAYPIPSIAQLAFLSEGLPTMGSLTRLTLARLPVSFLNEIPSNSFPLLECLVVLLLPIPEDIADLPLVKAFQHSLRLQKVAIGGLEIFSRLPLILPRGQISHFIVPDAMGSEFWADFLNSSPHVRYLEMKIDEGDVDDELSSSSTAASSTSRSRRTLPSLEHMTLWTWGFRNGAICYPSIFNNFDFPQLRSLRLVASFSEYELHDGRHQAERAALLDRIRSLEYLERLSLVTNSVKGIEDILKSTPHVHSLDIEPWHSVDELFALLTLKSEPEGSKLLPQLRTLELDVSDLVAALLIVPSLLANLIRSRVRIQSTSVASRLERVVFHGDSPIQLSWEAPYIHCLKPFIKDGLKIDFKLHDGGRSSRSTAFWIDRDTYLEDWREAGVAFNDTYYY